MKGRMFVVDSNTLVDTISSGIASIRLPIDEHNMLSGAQWVKTLSDIMADMLQIQLGDYVFLWETKSVQKSRIHGVYRVISKPYYDAGCADGAPVKIHIEKAYDFKEPIDEYDVLNCPYIKETLWTIVGKKVAGKSRGTSPLSLEETEYLIRLLAGKNPGFGFIEEDSSRYISVSNPLMIDYKNKGINPAAIDVSVLNPNKVNFFKEDGDLYYEKTLETIFNQEMTNGNIAFFKPFDINPEKVIWYSNYLPYSLEQSEMDYVILESEDGLAYTRMYVIDFMKNRIDSDHIHRVLLYAKWLNDTLGLGNSIAQPIIICSGSYDFKASTLGRRAQELEDAIVEDEKNYNTKSLKVFTYDFTTVTPKFTEAR